MNGTDLTPAASPDGTRLVYYAYCGASTVWGLHVMNLASGTVSTWTRDGRSMAIGYEWKGSSQAYEAYQAVLLLNIGSGPVQAHSRVLWHQGPGCATSCVYNAQISPDGTSLIAAATKIADQGKEYEESLVRISLPAGRVTSVLYRTTIITSVMVVPRFSLQGDSSGTYWLVQAGNNLGG